MPCNPIDFQMPYDSSEENSHDNGFVTEKVLLDEHMFVSKLFKNIRDNHGEEKLFIQSVEKITTLGYSIVDDDVKFRNKLMKLEAHDGSITKESFIKDIEEALCVKRHELIFLYKSLPNNGGMARPYYDEVKQKQLEHREADRKQWYHWLDAQRGLLLKHLELGKNMELKKKLEKIQNEIDRIDKLGSKELLESREIFGRNQEEFKV